MRTHITANAPIHIAALASLGLLLAGCGGTTGDEGHTPARSPETAPATSPSASPSTPASPAPPPGDAASPSTTPDPAETELVIEISTDGTDGPASPGEWRLSCSPAAGDHPDPEAACQTLAEVGPEAFDPVPAGRPCTHIYGGPEVATVTGHVGDHEVDAEFSKAGGCELDRWERLGPVLSP
ncbi:hypothetical protein GCM10027294_07980 [Marinactinospora endophytica]